MPRGVDEGGRRGWSLTGNNVARVQGVLVFDEAESIHQLDLGDFASAMGCEMGLDISLSDWRTAKVISIKSTTALCLGILIARQQRFEDRGSRIEIAPG